MVAVNNRRNTAPNGGYGWIIVFSAGIMSGIIASIFRCSGQVYGAMVERSELRHADVAVACVLPRVLTAIVAVVGSKLSEIYSFRVTMCSGMLIASVAMGLSSLTTRDSSLFTLTFGIFLGSGCGLTLTSCMMITGLYFTTRRSFAISLMTAFTNINTFFTPVLLQFLFDEYNLEGTLLIWSGVIFHGCAAALIIRQPIWARKIIEPQQQNSQSTSCKDFTTFVFKELWRDLRHFKNYFFVLLLVNRAAQFFGTTSVFLILPRFALEQNSTITHAEAAFLVSLISIGEITAKCFSGWFMTVIAKWIKISYLIALVVMAVLSSAFQLAVTYYQLAFCAVAYGIISGYAFVGYFVTIFDHFGPKKTPGANALQFMISSLFLLLAGPIAAWMRDATGSYAHGLILISVINVVSVILWLSEPLYFKRQGVTVM